MESLEALSELLTLLARLGRSVFAAIDGRCGSGKSTLAGLVAHRLGCPLFHTDDFLFPFTLCTPERYAAPGGNVHYERVEAELLRPLWGTNAACPRPFDCRSMNSSAPIRAELTGLALVEGSYAPHPALCGWCDRTVFLTCSLGEQWLRLLVHEGPKRLPASLEHRIPLEGAYSQSTGLPGGCDLVLDTIPWYRKQRWNGCSVPPLFRPVESFLSIG